MLYDISVNIIASIIIALASWIFNYKWKKYKIEKGDFRDYAERLTNNFKDRIAKSKDLNQINGLLTLILLQNGQFMALKTQIQIHNFSSELIRWMCFFNAFLMYQINKSIESFLLNLFIVILMYIISKFFGREIKAWNELEQIAWRNIIKSAQIKFLELSEEK